MTDSSSFTSFFKEEAKELVDVLEGQVSDQKEITFDESSLSSFPKADAIGSAGADAIKKNWKDLWSFYRTSEGGGMGNTSPLLLYKYDHGLGVEEFYPMWVADEDLEAEVLFTSLRDLINSAILEFAPGDGESSILKSSVNRIINNARNLIEESNGPAFFPDLIKKAIQLTEEQFEVNGEDGKKFQIDVVKLGRHLPNDGILIPFSKNASHHVLGSVIGTKLAKRRTDFLNKILILNSKLNEVIGVEEGKGPDGNTASKFEASMGFMGGRMNFETFSEAMPESGSVAMAPEKIERIKSLITVLSTAEQLLSDNASIIVSNAAMEDKSLDLESLYSGCIISSYSERKGCMNALSIFTEKMNQLSGLLAAYKKGELELNGTYNPGSHDEYFKNLDWRSFSEEEILSCPPVVLIADVTDIVDSELSEFSRLLSSNAPIKVVALKSDSTVDYRLNNAAKSDFRYHQELGSLVVSHRNAYALQATTVTAIDLFNGISDGFDAATPGFYYILSPSTNTGGNPFLWASAAVEGRAFPGFTYKGGLGSKWGSRFDVSNNPQPEKNWPSHDIKISGGEVKTLNVSFTFADFASQDGRYQSELKVVPADLWSDLLMPLSEYLELDDEETYTNLPFIWVVNEANEIQKAVVSWKLVLACKERLDFWQYLQESAGLNSYHVDKAIEETYNEIKAEAETTLNKAMVQHEVDLQSARDKATGEAMENLTSVLLNLDTSAMASAPSGGAGTPTTPAGNSSASDVEEVAEEAPAEEAVILSNDPYIDTALCTSCNECLDLNPVMFKYNSDKMAFIADPKAGTFSELVEAAELCPVSIIHPGAPLNTEEADLDDLVVRAEKFN